jgi:hypothetical protein
LQAVQHNPLAVLLATHLDRARLDLAVIAHHHHRVALRGAGYRLLWQGDGIAGQRLLQPHPHIQARQQGAIRVGQFGAQGDLAGAGVHGQV